MILPATTGPRSLTRTFTVRPLRMFVTRTSAPMGSVGCAAVSALMSNRSPLDVLRPWWAAPYQDASPVWVAPTTASMGRRGAGPGAVGVGAAGGVEAVAQAPRTRASPSQTAAAGWALGTR